MSQYKLIFTNIGLSKKQNAELNNDYIEITEFAVGSGVIQTLVPSMTALMHEEYRADINNVDTKNGTTVFDLIIPSSVGGFYIKEVALFDVDGDCICIGTVPITYKVNQDEGASKAIHLKVSTTSINSENIVFNTDDSLVYATVSYVNLEMSKKVNTLDIRNGLIYNDTDKPLSAAMGKQLMQYIDSINTLLLSDNSAIDNIQEIVDFIEMHQITLETLGVANISGLQNALNAKLGLNSNAVSASKLKMDTPGASCLELYNNTPNGYSSMKELTNASDAPNIGSWFIYSIRNNSSSGSQIAYGWSANANTVYQRNLNNGVWSSWISLSCVVGMIVMWSGNISNIPVGWVLCNGQNGTPNLTDRFIVGAGNSFNVGYVGGRSDAIVPSHQHHGWSGVAGNHSHHIRKQLSDAITSGEQNTTSAGGGWIDRYDEYDTWAAGDHNHEFWTDLTGEFMAYQNLPPYYALAYIMKL